VSILTACSKPTGLIADRFKNDLHVAEILCPDGKIRPEAQAQPFLDGGH
jgi:hypothetical protein